MLAFIALTADLSGAKNGIKEITISWYSRISRITRDPVAVEFPFD